MRRLTRLLICSLSLCWLAAPAVYAAGDDADKNAKPKTRREEIREEKAAKAKAKEEARQARHNRGKQQDEEEDKGGGEVVVTKGDFSRELAALNEAAGLLAEVKDEKGAQAVAKKLRQTFTALPVVTGGSEAELENLAKTQNRASRQMERLKGEPYFETAGLQECWTLMTDPFSRRSARKIK